MSDLKPLFNRVDHITIICDKESDMQTLHRFFCDKLHCTEVFPPVIFPPCKFYAKSRLSSSVFIGNIFLQFVYFYKIGGLRRLFFRRSPKFSSLIFEVDSLSDARKQLQIREIRYSEEKTCSIHKDEIPRSFESYLTGKSFTENEVDLFKTHYIDPYIFTASSMWKRPFDYFLSMSDQDSFVVGIKSYIKDSVNIDEIRQKHQLNLEKKQGETLGIEKVDRIVFSTNESMIFTAFFDHLFSPVEPISLTEWYLENCPTIKLEENQTEGITHLDLKVSSLMKAREYLDEKNIFYIDHPDYILIDPKLLLGLRILLKE